MAEFHSTLISDIVVPPRLRMVEEDHAAAIAVSVLERGLINPITIRKTPAAKAGKFTLIAGAHRLRAFQINEQLEIPAMIVEADKVEAQLLEISENLFRNELSVIDRAVFVANYRELWEQQHGEISRGGDRKSKGQVVPLIAASFTDHVAERLGLHPKSVKRLNQISQHLHSDLRDQLRGSDVADNQSALLKLAKMEPSMQRRAAIAYREEGDIKRALTLISDKPAGAVVDPDVRDFSSLIDLWSRVSPNVQAQFLAHIARKSDDEVAA